MLRKTRLSNAVYQRAVRRLNGNRPHVLVFLYAQSQPDAHTRTVAYTHAYIRGAQRDVSHIYIDFMPPVLVPFRLRPSVRFSNTDFVSILGPTALLFLPRSCRVCVRSPITLSESAVCNLLVYRLVGRRSPRHRRDIFRSAV